MTVDPIFTCNRHKDRTTKRVTYTAILGGYNGLVATGDTDVEARESVLAAAAEICRDYRPTVLSYRGHTLVVFRSSGAWAYTYTSPEDGKDKPEVRDYYVDGYATRDEAERAVRHHVASNLLDARTQEVSSVFDLVTDDIDVRELQRGAQWQRAHHHAVALGEKNPHEWASRHAAEPCYETVAGYQEVCTAAIAAYATTPAA